MATRSEETSTQAADTVTGAVVEAAQAVGDPGRTTARQVRRFERAGAPVNRRLERQVRRAAEQAVDTTSKLLNGTVTEGLVVRGLRLVKSRAGQQDLVGAAAYRSLELLHGGFGRAARSLARFQDASQPPARSNDGKRTRTSARRTADSSTPRTRTATRTSSGTSSRTPRTSARRAPRKAAGQQASTTA
jgi:hypothetical protein